MNVWPAIDDRYNHEAAVSEMCDAHAGAERQGSMRRGELGRIEDYPASRSASCFSGAIPRGRSNLRVGFRIIAQHRCGTCGTCRVCSGRERSPQNRGNKEGSMSKTHGCGMSREPLTAVLVLIVAAQGALLSYRILGGDRATLPDNGCARPNPAFSQEKQDGRGDEDRGRRADHNAGEQNNGKLLDVACAHERKRHDGEEHRARCCDGAGKRLVDTAVDKFAQTHTAKKP